MCEPSSLTPRACHASGMCEVTPSAELALTLEPEAASTARGFMREAACLTHHARVLQDAELLVSELVANGIRHAAPPIVLRVDCDGASMQVCVSDGSPALPRVLRVPPEAVSGRGMALVDFISEQWGVEPSEHGKTTWFRLGVEPVDA